MHLHVYSISYSSHWGRSLVGLKWVPSVFRVPTQTLSFIKDPDIQGNSLAIVIITGFVLSQHNTQKLCKVTAHSSNSTVTI